VLTQHAACAWGVLPIRHLSVEAAVLPLEVMQRIGQLSGLTYLGCSAMIPAGCSSNLGSELRRLKGLRELRLDVCFEEFIQAERALNAERWRSGDWSDEDGEGDLHAVHDKVAAATQQLLQAVAQLPCLERLSLAGLIGGFTAAAVQELVGAPRLQRLQLGAGLLRRKRRYGRQPIIKKMRVQDVQAIMSKRCSPCVVDTVGGGEFGEMQPPEV
jgi:hypothetical protein